MTEISDDELLLFHLGEELGPERMDAIASTIARDPSTAARYGQLRRLLTASTLALTPPNPGSDFEQRLWAKMAPVVAAARPSPRTNWLAWWLPGLALAAGLALIVVVSGRWPGADDPTGAPVPAVNTLALSDDAPERVLVAHLTRHLAQTERLLRVADNGGAPTDVLASALIDSNRLYAAAAQRAGKPALAHFLVELEPILRELANAEGDAALGGADLARDEIRSRDLLFRLRTLESIERLPSQRL